MNEKVAKYLEEKREKERKEILIAAGLYEKEYAPKSQELPNGEYPRLDTTIIPNRPYKAIPIEITDEEYEQIKKYAVKPPIFLPKPNVIAKILLGVGICVYGLGFIGGMQLQSAAEELLSLAIIVWAIAAVGGTILLGLSEIVKLLQNIRDKN